MCCADDVGKNNINDTANFVHPSIAERALDGVLLALTLFLLAVRNKLLWRSKVPPSESQLVKSYEKWQRENL